MIYRIELIDQEENLLSSYNYNDKKDMMIAYNRVLKNVNRRYKLHGCTMQLFQGIHEDDLKELEKYRINF
jgi:hypothetical protein